MTTLRNPRLNTGYGSQCLSLVIIGSCLYISIKRHFGSLHAKVWCFLWVPQFLWFLDHHVTNLLNYYVNTGLALGLKKVGAKKIANFIIQEPIYIFKSQKNSENKSNRNVSNIHVVLICCIDFSLLIVYDTCFTS